MLLICFGIFALMAMIAVIADFSFMQHQRNMMQTAADSAAMAGAEELNYGDQVAAGKADAASNGYADGASSVTVSINNPPSTGPHASNTTYVEATISKPEPTYFS
jgi:Flp pilus assembly protein TadG